MHSAIKLHQHALDKFDKSECACHKRSMRVLLSRLSSWSGFRSLLAAPASAALVVVGCSPTLANNTELGTSVRQHLNAAWVHEPSAEKDENAQENMRREAEACFRDVSELINKREDGSALYDPDKTTLDTVKGPMTLAQVQEKCKSLTQVRMARLPTAAIHDPALEQAILAAAQRSVAPATAKVVILTGRDWDVERNQVTGAVLRRSRGATIAVVNPDGTCALKGVTVGQEYVGSEFQGAAALVEAPVTVAAVNCEALKGR
jgi:hypothetical protein